MKYVETNAEGVQPQHTSMLTPITTIVSLDEPAFALYEADLIDPNRRPQEWRRFQFIYVNRDGRVARFCRDLGSAAEVKQPPLLCPAEWELTVGQLLEFADAQKDDNRQFESILDELWAGSTLIEDWQQQRQERSDIIHSRSVIGPYVKKQNYQFSMDALREIVRERRDDRIRRLASS